MSAVARASSQAVSERVEADADLGVMHNYKLSPVLTGEMSRLFSLGYSLIPLSLTRKPLVNLTRADGTPSKRLPLSLVIDKMAGAGSSLYGIRLPGMIVVDLDTDTPEAIDYVERRFGETRYKVKSPKGVHYYYRAGRVRPRNIKLPGFSIDFKTGCQEHVSGPFSIRADGGEYLPLTCMLPAPCDLPLLVDKGAEVERNSTAVSFDGQIKKGSRNTHLCRVAVQYVSEADTRDQLLENLLAYRNIYFEEPETFPDKEVEAIADWAFQKKLEGKIWHGRRSEALIPRDDVPGRGVA